LSPRPPTDLELQPSNIARKKRARAAVDRRLERAKEALAGKPDDAKALLAFAEASTRHAAWVGRRDVARAIAAARKARTLRPQLLAAHYWEAASLELSGAKKKAAEGYRRALACAPASAKEKRLLRSAVERLWALEARPRDGAVPSRPGHRPGH
jgi:Flp pilus assembly protein TadD